MRQRLWFNDTCLTDFGLRISGDYTEKTPERLGEEVQVPGRSGAYWIGEGAWGNLEIEYPAYIFGNVRENLARLRSILGAPDGYAELRDDYHPDEYRMVRYVSGLGEQVSVYADTAKFSLVFACKPQRYLVAGLRSLVMAEEEQSDARGDLITDNPAVIKNPTGMQTRPMLRVFYDDRTQGMTVTVGGTLFTIAPCGHYCIGIDLEARTCYYNGENLSRYVTVTVDGATAMDYPAFGDKTTVTRGTNVRALQIYPRWWRL